MFQEMPRGYLGAMHPSQQMPSPEDLALMQKRNAEIEEEQYESAMLKVVTEKMLMSRLQEATAQLMNVAEADIKAIDSSPVAEAPSIGRRADIYGSVVYQLASAYSLVKWGPQR